MEANSLAAIVQSLQAGTTITITLPDDPGGLPSGPASFSGVVTRIGCDHLELDYPLRSFVVEVEGPLGLREYYIRAQ